MTRQLREIEDAGFARFAEPGDKVEGPVIAYDTEGATNYSGDVCPALTLDTDEGPIMVTCDKPQLLRKVQAARPVPGLWMRVQFVEERESANGRWYKMFGVWVAVDGDNDDNDEEPPRRRQAPPERRPNEQRTNDRGGDTRRRERQTRERADDRHQMPRRTQNTTPAYGDEEPF